MAGEKGREIKKIRARKKVRERKGEEREGGEERERERERGNKRPWEGPRLVTINEGTVNRSEGEDEHD